MTQQELQNKMTTFFQTFLTKARERDSSAEIMISQQHHPFEGTSLFVTLNAESGSDKWMISVRNNDVGFIRIVN